MIKIENQKMSKSLGNLYTLDDLAERGCTPAECRYVLVSGHYRKQLNFTFDSLRAAREALGKLARAERDLARAAGQDEAPSYRSLHAGDQADNQNLRILDTTAVADRLRAALENASRNKTGFGDRDTLQHLILAWGAMPKRRFPRQASKATLPAPRRDSSSL